MYRDPSGKLIFEALVGGGVGAVYGLANGLLSGDSGQKLATDVAMGIGAGFLVGLTDGASLFMGGAAEAAAGIAARGAINVGAEAARQKLNDGCVHDSVALALAALGSFGADGLEGGIKSAAGEIGRAGEVTAAGIAGMAAGVPGAIYSGQQGAEAQQQAINDEFRQAIGGP